MTAAPSLPPSEATIVIASRLFGPIEARVGAWITFPDGLPGFSGERRFLVLPAQPEGVYWLQDCAEPGVAFCCVDPFRFHEGYAIDLDDASDAEADAHAAGEVSVLCIVTFPTPERPAPTINLQGPLLVNFRDRTGRQVVLEQGGWHTKHPIDLAKITG